MQHDTVWYFAYGSNMDPARFESRVGAPRSSRRARLDGYRLRFAGSVRAEGGGGAVVDTATGKSVNGVLFEIDAGQLAVLDRVESDETRDPAGVGRRLTVDVESSTGGQRAEVYTVEDDGDWLGPSDVYLGHLLDGLEAAGHCHHALAHVRRVAARAAGSDFVGDV